MEDSSLRQFCRLTNTLNKVRNGTLTHKNDERTHNVYENKDGMTICQAIVQTFWPTIHTLCGNSGRKQLVGERK